MANWQLKLDLKDVYHKDLSIQELAGIVADRLEALVMPLCGDTPSLILEQSDLVDYFRSMRDDLDVTAEDFDYLMSDLYDWADTSLDDKCNGKKLCWVETF